MSFPSRAIVEGWKSAWADKFVRVKTDLAPELLRYEGQVGRVVTITYSGRALVDFADGPWTDIANFEAVLEVAADPGKFDATANSAQKFPARQG